MIFQQLFEPILSTFAYLLGCEETRKARLVDPVHPTWPRDLEALHRSGLELAYTLDTHIHADQISAAVTLRRDAGSRIAHPACDLLDCVDWPMEEGQPLTVGRTRIEPLFTPGHTDGHHAYRIGERVLTGDALLIDGCGRTDFQNGDARFCTEASTKSCSPCRTTHWCTPHTITKGGAYRASPRRRRAIPAWEAANRCTPSPRSWERWTCRTPNSSTSPCPATANSVSARPVCRITCSSIASRWTKAVRAECEGSERGDRT